METRGISTRLLAKTQCIEKNEEIKDLITCSKRCAEDSPDSSNKKRSVLCNITNTTSSNSNTKLNSIAKKNGKVIKGSTSSINSNNTEEENLKKAGASIQEQTELQLSESTEDESCMEVDDVEVDDNSFPLKPVPPDVEDFDVANSNDPYSESANAPYIFQYYRDREQKFTIEKYIERQPEVTRSMRAVLVDWMVEVQESFELNHETLYLAVKLVDIYLMKHEIAKSNLQLVGATAVLIASKYDERMPPLVDDFLYICDDSYSRRELLSMEASILRSVDFDLGIPISYRFLRRYARCARATMDTLTLARYILETALMDYELIDIRDSKIAAAALLLALMMKQLGDWTPTLEHYTGYKSESLTDLVKALNKNIAAPPNKNLLTVRTKYSHKIFFEVAKIPPLKFVE